MQQRYMQKDFILIGVLTALMWFICMLLSGILSFAGPVSVFYPSIVPVVNGIVMMLLLAKVRKRCVYY